ncbi:glycosyltransferase family 2 protein [Phaeovulum vinaykumarii]
MDGPRDLRAVLKMRDLRAALKMRRRRQRLLWRALRARHALHPVADRTAAIAPGDILAFACLRNEAVRLPHFLAHYRRLGVRHFLVVDNDSTDTTRALLADQPDVSLWHTAAGYKAARFGLDWTTWLQIRHGHGHWCLTLDADEILIYPYWETRPLPALTEWLDAEGRPSFAAMMLDLYPRGPLEAQTYSPGDDPFAVLSWYDAGNYTIVRRAPMDNLWIQGGVRSRVLLDAPRRGPTLTKLPLVRWNRRFVYVNSAHAALPPRLNRVYDDQGGEAPSGLLLHTKFLPQIVQRSAEEKARRQHFADADAFAAYYDRLIASPDLWCPASTRLGGWRSLEARGLMSRGGWI